MEVNKLNVTSLRNVTNRNCDVVGDEKSKDGTVELRNMTGPSNLKREVDKMWSKFDCSPSTSIFQE